MKINFKDIKEFINLKVISIRICFFFIVISVEGDIFCTPEGKKENVAFNGHFCKFVFSGNSNCIFFI